MVLSARAVGAVVAGALLLAGVGGGARALRARLDRPEGTRIVGAGFPRTLIGLGPARILAAPPARVASLTVAADEILTALAGPGRLVAVSRYARDPAVSLCADRVPAAAVSVRGDDPEAIVALTPDVVFVASYTLASGVRILEGAGVPVVRFRTARSFEDIAKNVLLTARVVGEDARGEALVHDMEARLRAIDARVLGLDRPRVLYYSAVGYTAGAGTVVDEKIQRAGGANVARDLRLTGYVNVGLDVLASLDPDLIVVPRWTEDPGPPVRDVTESAPFRDGRAVRAGAVRAVAAGPLTAESPEAVRGVEELARIFHPEAFAS